MGYDMYAIDAPAYSEHENTEKARELRDEWHAQYYFRLNISGMSWMRRVMYALDLIDRKASVPDWPARPEPFDEDDEPITDEAKAYRKQCLTLLAMAGEGGRIPGFKFGSNDGWIITPDECHLMASALKSVTPEWYKTTFPQDDFEDAVKIIHRFGEFAERAAGLEGFRVY